MRRSNVTPMYALGDVNGDEKHDAIDVELAGRAAAGDGEVPCPRAADMDYSGDIGSRDLQLIASIVGETWFALTTSPHMRCMAFSRVASRDFGEAGEEIPLLLLGAFNGTPVVVSGPATVDAVDSTSGRFNITIDPNAARNELVDIRICRGDEPTDVCYSIELVVGLEHV